MNRLSDACHKPSSCSGAAAGSLGRERHAKDGCQAAAEGQSCLHLRPRSSQTAIRNSFHPSKLCRGKKKSLPRRLAIRKLDKLMQLYSLPPPIAATWIDACDSWKSLLQDCNIAWKLRRQPELLLWRHRLRPRRIRRSISINSRSSRAMSSNSSLHGRA